MSIMGLIRIFRSLHTSRVKPRPKRPGISWSKIFCKVVVTTVPSGDVICETTTGTLIVVHLETSAPMTKKPKIEAPSVIFCRRLPLRSLKTKFSPFL